jgi:glycosyltransferase involved in cell wall biosynthesis
MRILFVSWRDLAHPQAGGSEVLIDRLARGVQARGHEAALLCGRPVAPRPYTVVAAGGTYSQYLRVPLAHARRFRDWDLLVDVENGIPYFSPLWRRRPSLCLMHHVHKDQWATRFPAPVAAVGRALEHHAVPLVYRNRLFVAVSPSTADAVAELGVPRSRIRVMPEGVDPAPTPAPTRSSTPLFLALGRLVPHKRVDVLLRAWDRVRAVTGGTLVVAGDGPELPRLRTLAGPGVELRGPVSEAEKHRLLGSAWLFVHTAHHEGWGIVVMEAAAAATPTLAFDVPGVRDAVVHGSTGELVASEDALVDRWIHLAFDAAERERLGVNARARATGFDWDTTVDRFLGFAEEALALASLP